MALKLNKPRLKKLRGLTTINVADPVMSIDTIKLNTDGTMAILVLYYENQLTLDNGGRHFDKEILTVNTPANFEAQTETLIKKLVAFSGAT